LTGSLQRSWHLLDKANSSLAASELLASKADRSARFVVVLPLHEYHRASFSPGFVLMNLCFIPLFAIFLIARVLANVGFFWIVGRNASVAIRSVMKQ